jgi:hypothetical protein
MKTNRYIQNSLYILSIFIITTTIISLSFLYINKEAYTQDNVYDNNIPPDLEGLSLNDTLETIKRKLESRYIYQRYTKTINHMTAVDPYLLYSQRYYTQYYNDFIATTLCNGQEYLVKFDDINNNNNS